MIATIENTICEVCIEDCNLDDDFCMDCYHEDVYRHIECCELSTCVMCGSHDIEEQGFVTGTDDDICEGCLIQFGFVVHIGCCGDKEHKGENNYAFAY